MTRIALRKMEKGDVQRLLDLYQRFAEQYVGCSRRDVEHYRKLLRKKSDLRWVALDENNKVIGYALGHYEKWAKRGNINRVVVDPDYDFTTVAKALVAKLQSILIQKGAAAIYVGVIRNPFYSEVFPDMGFLKFDTDGVFMYTLLDVTKFLHEITPIIAKRLKRIEGWSGLIQIQCGGHSLFLKKERGEVKEYFWTNVEVDCEVVLDEDTLVKLLLGAMDVMDAQEARRVIVRTNFDDKKSERLLRIIFSKNQFLALDYW
jgi:N-acetylglutamate synthase-like GNAT family acetyltransferase